MSDPTRADIEHVARYGTGGPVSQAGLKALLALDDAAQHLLTVLERDGGYTRAKAAELRAACEGEAAEPWDAMDALRKALLRRKP